MYTNTRFFFFLILLSACAGSEVGNPPFQPEEPRPGFDVDDVRARDIPPDNGQDIRGHIIEIPGSALPAGTISVSIVALDVLDEPTFLSMDDSGIFRGSTPAEIGEEARIQVATDEMLSPLDVLIQEGPTLQPITRTFSECLLFETRDIEVGEEGAELRMLNQCNESISISGLSWRFYLNPAFQIAPSELDSIEPQAITTLHISRVQFRSSSEDTLFIDIDEPWLDRQPITVRPKD